VTVRPDVVLTFDLEDWFQLTGRRFGISPGRVATGRLRSQVVTILDLLDQSDSKATFFVLGMSAELCPDLIAEVAKRGHEVASHGYGHELVKTLTPAQFRADLDRSLLVLTAIVGKQPVGYRAPEFSIDRQSFWALDELLDRGIVYDSSIFPFRGPRYGIEDAPMGLHQVRTPSGREIAEIPLAVLALWGKRLPVAGGGYWRLLPAMALAWAMDRVSAERVPMVYFHPAEFDRRPLDLPFLSRRIATFTLKQNLGRSSMTHKLRALLCKYSGSTAEAFVKNGRAQPAAD
jgi:polysaccharide deacetylase family protein (PEP-CTERM system associated)